MAFVNEYVSEDDDKKYGLEELDKRYFKGHFQPHWTRDYERNMYLRFMRDGGEDGMWQQTFTFYWKGTLFEVGLESEGGGKRGDVGWKSWLLRYLSLPKHLEVDREQIIADLKAALTAYGGAGIHTSYTECVTTFKF